MADPAPTGAPARPAVTPDTLRPGRVIAALVAAVLLVELFAQTFIFLWAGKRYKSLSRHNWSPYGLVRNNPDSISPQYYHNRNGFRNLQDFTQEKPPHTLRVMVLGGSTMYSGLGGAVIDGVDRVDSSSTVAQHLERVMQRDPELAGVRLEVINAAVNFNRIVEVSVGYLTEWSHWSPDVVIVGGSANNFSYYAPKGSVRARKWGIQNDHPWRLEFDRIVNRQGPLALAEKGMLAVESGLASAALLRKFATPVLDLGFATTQRLAARLHIAPDESAAPPPPADFAEFDEYINEYLSYADAMATVARRNGQEMAFFWEYLLGHLGGIKPFSPIEQVLYQRNRLATWREDATYDWRARDQLAAFCRERGLRFLDPLERLKTYNGTVFIDYLHYTSEGNRVMAEFMYERLKDVLHQRAARLR